MHEPDADPAGTREEERTLVEGVAGGDVGAFEALYDRYAAQAYGLAVRISRSQEIAEEAVQDAFLTLWRRPTAYRPGKGTLAAYLLRTVHNRTVDTIRREEALRRRELAQTVTIEEALEDGPPEQAWLSIRRERVRAALALLSAAHREALELAYFGGLSCTEIATRLGIPLGTAKTRIRDGMIRLRTLLADAQAAET